MPPGGGAAGDNGRSGPAGARPSRASDNAVPPAAAGAGPTILAAGSQLLRFQLHRAAGLESRTHHRVLTHEGPQ